jgi:hypothetical protein
MAEPDSIRDERHVDPYLLPADRQGWRGLSIPGNHKRKWYTVLHTEQVLVTALLLIPGERSIRHSHETGELSIHYSGELNPVVSWNPPGVVHPNAPSPAPSAASALEQQVSEAVRLSSGDQAMGHLLQELLEEQLRLRERLEEVVKPKLSPFMIIDILFPPFKTTIDDPAVPDKKTVVGQWYD